MRNTGQSPLSSLFWEKKAANIKKEIFFFENFWSAVFLSEKRRRHGELKRARTSSILGLHILCHHGRCFALGRHLLKVRTDQLLLCALEQVFLVPLHSGFFCALHAHGRPPAWWSTLILQWINFNRSLRETCCCCCSCSYSAAISARSRAWSTSIIVSDVNARWTADWLAV